MESIIPGGELEWGGAINTIMPHRVISKNCTGMVVSGFLVEVEGTNLDELRKKYPEAFKRPCDRLLVYEWKESCTEVMLIM